MKTKEEKIKEEREKRFKMGRELKERMINFNWELIYQKDIY